MMVGGSTPPAKAWRFGRPARSGAGARAPAPRSPAALRTALQFSVQNILDRRVLKGKLGVNALEFRVLRLELTQPLELRYRNTCVLRFPVVVRRRADPVLAHDLCHRYPGFPFPQDRYDLRLSEFRLLHRPSHKQRV